MTDQDTLSAEVNILGISGSLRSGSYNSALLRLAMRLAAPADVRLWRGLADVPPFNEDHEDRPPAAVTHMRSAIESADAVLIATPEYNTTVPGQLKTMLDWASRPTHRGVLVGKPTAVVGASLTPYGAQWAQQAIRGVLNACGAHVVGEPLCVAHADTAFDAEGHLHDPQSQAHLARVVGELADVPRWLYSSSAPSAG
ncbi:MAG: NAD(P)H-dependent oxidoreductase [Pseudonocardiaceae bacterium]|nr:NAD(P)H-dependent oxidoreductase [Pseudonocardiaceae bacterium]